MPDVMYEPARADYDDAYEIYCGGIDYLGDVVGVATFPVDREFKGTPTGVVDPFPIRLYIADGEGHMTGDAGAGMTAYLTLDDAAELRELLDAAILQVELVRHRQRRGAGTDARERLR